MAVDPDYISAPALALRRIVTRMTGYVVTTDQASEECPVVIDHADRAIRVRKGLSPDHFGLLMHRTAASLAAGRVVIGD